MSWHDMPLSAPDYSRLLELRTSLRRFLRWSEDQARGAGLTPTQHQLLLAIAGHRDSEGPNVGEVAEYLLLRHHSAVELIDRAERAGLVRRATDEHSRSVVRVRLTELGEAKLNALSAAHLRELAQLAPSMRALWETLAPDAHA
jgi:DNA-binding MarR family transcriptional regulator